LIEAITDAGIKGRGALVELATGLNNPKPWVAPVTLPLSLDGDNGEDNPSTFIITEEALAIVSLLLLTDSTSEIKSAEIILAYALRSDSTSCHTAKAIERKSNC
jgi:hypothetical protein